MPAAGDPDEEPTPLENARSEVRREDARGNGGTLTGRVVYRGPLPETTIMYVSEAGNLEAHTIIVDPPTRGLKNAVVWLEGTRRAHSISRLGPAAVDQINWTFIPHVVAVRVGQSVQFKNSDIANHNVHSWTPGHEFNMGTPTGESYYRVFRRPTGSKPVAVKCDTHDWMLVWIYVFAHDDFAVTDKAGVFRIEGVRPGKWRLNAHHADGGLHASREVVVRRDKPTELIVELSPDETIDEPSQDEPSQDEPSVRRR